MATLIDMGELRDKAASLIGENLLKGYRMLATHCVQCGVSYNTNIVYLFSALLYRLF